VSEEIEQRMMELLPRLREIGPGQPPPEEVGLSRAQITLLDWVARSHACSFQELAEGLSLSAPTVSVGVRRLEEAGLLGRSPNPEDGRAWQLHLTGTGQELWARVHAYRREKVRRVLAALTSEEQQMLVTLLDKALGTAGEGPAAL
jgi:DNA-binding MarR family transcriptional regulator